MSRLWHGISGLGAVGALVCFFLPWMMVSCGDQVRTPTGWQVAVGGTVETSTGPQDFNGHIFAFLAFVAAVVILLMALVGGAMGPSKRRLGIAIAIAIIFLSACSGISLLGFFLKNQTDLTGDVDVIVEYKPAFLGTALGYILALISSMIGLATLRPPPKPASIEDSPD